MRLTPRPIETPAAIRSSGADTAAADVTICDAEDPARPSQFSSALPPSDTPTA